jgi:hypothetical protein
MRAGTPSTDPEWMSLDKPGSVAGEMVESRNACIEPSPQHRAWPNTCVDFAFLKVPFAVIFE